MIRNHVLCGAAAICIACGGCSADGADRRLRVGTEDPGDDGNGGAGFGGSGPAPDGGVTGSWQALSVHVEDIDEVTIEVITLACAGDCADVEAVAHGGNPPYAFEWEDGTTNPMRRVCLGANATLNVSATDTALDSDEFRYDAHSASVALEASVLECSDAGVVPPADGSFCIGNPSLEGTPGLSEQGWNLPEWTMCSATPDVNPFVSTPAATDGATYLGLVGGSGVLYESAGTAFCTPLEPGKEIAFTVDVAASAYIGGPTQLELWGGSTSCAQEELLWASPMTTDIDTWHTYCGTFTPSQGFAFLSLRPVEPASVTSMNAYLLVDNFRAVESCP